MSKQTPLTWQAPTTPQELRGILTTLGKHYPISSKPRKGAVTVKFAPGAEKGSLSVDLARGRAVVRYDKPCHALRAAGALLSGTVKPGVTYTESLPFETFGIMLDCSRNAVMTVEHFQGWLRQLALLGYNMGMLYTEDTYQLPGEPCFGYQRGRYTPEELKAIDDYAAGLGIEMVGCIQTLGHLEQVLKWSTYRKIRDTDKVLLVDEPATYALIEKMIANFASCFRSRRIHIGQDEAHDLGRGSFMDRHGYQRGYDIFNRHLGRVVDICRKAGLAPMIWSDMFFRMGSVTQDYYDKDCHIPADVAKDIPKDVQLVYWDYYHDSEEFYADFISRHREAGFEPVMASGTWTWSRLWYDRVITEKTAEPCIRASRAAGLKEFLFTIWGDDGGYCEFDSAMAGLAWGAELAYTGSPAGRGPAKRFAAICGGDYDKVMAAAEMENDFAASTLLWDDPLLAFFWNGKKAADPKFPAKAIKKYQAVLKALAGQEKVVEPVDMAHARRMLECLLKKAILQRDLQAAYARRNKPALRKVKQQIPAMVRAIEALDESFRRQWLRRNKPNGLETIQIRQAALRQRFIELSRRLGELIAGRINSIAELDEPVPANASTHHFWHNTAAAGIV